MLNLEARVNANVNKCFAEYGYKLTSIYPRFSVNSLSFETRHLTVYLNQNLRVVQDKSTILINGKLQDEYFSLEIKLGSEQPLDRVHCTYEPSSNSTINTFSIETLLSERHSHESTVV